jgi:hypothetical protein
VKKNPTFQEEFQALKQHMYDEQANILDANFVSVYDEVEDKFFYYVEKLLGLQVDFQNANEILPEESQEDKTHSPEPSSQFLNLGLADRLDSRSSGQQSRLRPETRDSLNNKILFDVGNQEFPADQHPAKSSSSLSQSLQSDLDQSDHSECQNKLGIQLSNMEKSKETEQEK